MSRVLDDMDSRLSTSQMAELWFARLMAPDCSEAERQALERWCAEAPEHARAYADTEALWRRLEGLEADEVVGPLADAALQPDAMDAWTAAATRRRARTDPTPPRTGWRWPAALAASLLVAVAGWQLLSVLVPERIEFRQYQTGADLESVTLEDGSQVQMDLSTRMEVRMARDRREVRLLHGRAIFQVVPERVRPFVVDAGPGSVTALGTRFQVDRLNDGTVVTLMEGLVAVSESGAAPDSALRLQPGQQARYSPEQGAWRRYDVDTAAATSWSQGFHVFSGTPLAEAVREINRYATHRLRLADPSLDALVISGNFKAGDSDTIAAAMPAVLPVRAEVSGDEIVLTRR